MLYLCAHRSAARRGRGACLSHPKYLQRDAIDRLPRIRRSAPSASHPDTRRTSAGSGCRDTGGGHSCC
ncbi:hypothetical protein NQ910_18735, partial [Acinetobacter baumannii]|nr:hypothetical protein [Acinetobacter baumannii]